VVQASAATAAQVKGLDLLVVGSPTQRFTSTPAATAFAKNLMKGSLDGTRVAAFDTRFTQENIDKIKVLAFFVRIFGYAAEPLARRLQNAGGELAAAPEGFYVADSEGPLLDGELDRSRVWARQLVALA
jgi:hypothetical protein